jgi:hypothetical protein
VGLAPTGTLCLIRAHDNLIINNDIVKIDSLYELSDLNFSKCEDYKFSIEYFGIADLTDSANKIKNLSNGDIYLLLSFLSIFLAIIAHQVQKRTAK